MSATGRQPQKALPRNSRSTDAADGGTFKGINRRPGDWLRGRQAPRTTGALWKPTLPAFVVPTLANPRGRQTGHPGGKPGGLLPLPSCR